VPYVRDEIRKHCQRYTDKMEEHPSPFRENILTKNLMRSIKIPRRLKKRLPQDLWRLSGAIL